ncbi:protein GL2-INTERACTING REPRESSOR 2 [Oryza sativa Japonica Group]|uniref:Os05g0442000 protein n=2 Tax=Oryza sativa subsp. japonica TaxID=39947 RepID=A0A0P0WMY5_ORYSJ|nr:putative lysozyme-like protein [Oryza sativa Japonica Group]BAH93179.1 Os05g0442000 [Oryza sativa Japonica Group]BAS94251.1 Os05g0442000 [Oryza sativa Japonica Group]|eukprot:NP_001174451.1 Os05g0442000 [Oryza sativa Japonica Group]
MSRNNGGKGGKLQEARVNLPSTRGRGGTSSGVVGGSSSPRRLSSSSSSTASPPSSCVSSEGSPEAGGGGGGGGSSGMILAGCPRCMMYVMLSREDPKCPKCHSTVLLDFNDAAAAADPRQVGAGKSKGKHRG